MSSHRLVIGDEDATKLEEQLDALGKAKLVGQNKAACKAIEDWIDRHRLHLQEKCNVKVLKDLDTGVFEAIEQKKFHDAFPSLIRKVFLPGTASDQAFPHPRSGIFLLFEWIDEQFQDDERFWMAATLLNEVLEVDAYREIQPVTWLAETATLFLNSLLENLKSPGAFTDERKKLLRVSFGIVKSLVRDFYRDSGTGEFLKREKLIEFFARFKELGAKLQNVTNKDEDLFALYYIALNEFLLSQALDFRSLALDLFKSQHAWVRQSWSSFTQSMQTHVAQHLRILFSTGVLQDASSRRLDTGSSIAELFELLKSHKVACASSDGPESAQGQMVHDEKVVVDLFAELVVQLTKGPTSRNAERAQPEKKAKTVSPMEWLTTQIVSDSRTGDGVRPRFCILVLTHLLDTHSELWTDSESEHLEWIGAGVVKTFAHRLRKPKTHVGEVAWLMRCLERIFLLVEGKTAPLDMETWTSVLESAIEHLKMREMKLEDVMEVSFRLAARILANERIPASPELLPLIWQFTVRFFSIGWLQQSSFKDRGTLDQGTPWLALEVRAAFVDFLVVVLRRFKLDSSINIESWECSRESLLKLILAKIDGRNVTQVEDGRNVTQAPSALGRAHLKLMGRLIQYLLLGIGPPQDSPCASSVRAKGTCGHSLRAAVRADVSSDEEDQARWKLAPRSAHQSPPSQEARFEQALKQCKYMLRGAQRLGTPCLLCQLDGSAPQVLVPQGERTRMRKLFLEWAQHTANAEHGVGRVPQWVLVLVCVFDSPRVSIEENADYLQSLLSVVMPTGDTMDVEGSSEFSMASCLERLSAARRTKEQHLDMLESIEHVVDRISALASLLDSKAGESTVLRRSLFRCCRDVLSEDDTSTEMELDHFDDGSGRRRERSMAVRLKYVAFRVLLKALTDSDLTAELLDYVRGLLVKSSASATEIVTLAQALCEYGPCAFLEVVLEAVGTLQSRKQELSLHERQLISIRASSCIITRASEQSLAGELMHNLVDGVGNIFDALRVRLQPEVKPGLDGKVRQTFVCCVREFVLIQKDQDFVDGTVLRCLSDASFAVRFHAVKTIPTIFSTWTNTIPVFLNVSLKLPEVSSAPGKEEAVVHTRAMAFGQIASLPEQFSCEEVQGQCISWLCKAFVIHSSEQTVIKNALVQVSKESGFASLADLLQDHLHSILCDWMHSGLSWADFPHTLAGFSCMHDFVERVAAPTLLPELLLEHGEVIAGSQVDACVEIDRFVAIHREADTRQKLVLRCYPYIYARIVPLIFGSIPTKAKKAKAASRFMNEKLLAGKSGNPKQVPFTLLGNILNGGLVPWRADDPDQTLLDKDTVSEMVIKTFNLLAKQNNGIVGDVLLGSSRDSGGSQGGRSQRPNDGSCAVSDHSSPTDRLQLLYLDLLRTLKNAKTARRKRRVLHAVEVLLCDSMLGPHLTQHRWVLWHTIALLLQGVRDNTVKLEAGYLLDKVLTSVRAKGEDAMIFPMLSDIICTLVPQVGSHPSGPDVLFAIIQRLVCESSTAPGGSTAIARLPPFPRDRSVFEKLARDSSKDKSLLDELTQFCNSSEHVPTEVKRASLVHLHEQLRNARKALPDLVSQAGANGGSCHIWGRCTQKLFSTMRTVQSEDVLQLAGRCLGQIGPAGLQGQALAQERQQLPLVELDQKRRAGASDITVSNRVLGVAIVKHLRSYLTDDDVKVIEVASNLLKGLLRLPSWKSELTDGDTDRVANGHALDLETREFLTPFLSCQQQSTTLVRSKTEVARRSRIGSLAWSPVGSTYAEWLPKLTSSLCELDSSDAVWPLCREMAELKLDFAEMIFPNLVFGVYLSAREENDTDTLNEIGQKLHDALLADQQADVKAVRMALNVLELFRLFRLRVLRSKGGFQSTLGKSVVEWKTCFWFQIPYVVVSEAALRCGAYLTALMYMEIASHGKSQKLTRGTSKLFEKAAAGPAASLVASSAALGSGMSRGRSSVMGNWDVQQQIFLAAYRQVNEPDGLIAFNKRADFDAHFITWEQEGEWIKALGYFDTLVSTGSSGAIDSVSGQAQSGDMGLCSSLRDVGCSHLTLLAARDFASRKQPGSSEALLEAAWRAENWTIDPTLEVGEQQSAQPGFNGCLYRALRALQQVMVSGGPRVAGGLDTVLQHVKEARKTTVQDMFNQNLQSTKRSQAMLARFQLCEDLHEFAVLTLDSKAQRANATKTGAFRADADAVEQLVDKWRQRVRSHGYNFSLCENALALQQVLLSLAGQENKLVNHLCLAAKTGSKSANLTYARSAMHKLQLRGQDASGPGAWCLRAAKLMWLDGQHDKAVGFLRHLASFLREKEDRSDEDTRLLSRSLAVNAGWLSSSRSEGWKEIQKMLKECVELLDDSALDSSERCEARAKAHFKLASFMDVMYSREQEDAEEMSQEQAGQQLHAIKELREKQPRLYKERKFRIETHLKEQAERQALKREFVLEALQNYMQCARLGSGRRHQSVVFRVLHLWFENSDNDQVNQLMCDELEASKPSKVFLIVARQAVSRMEHESTSFQKAIRSLLLGLLERYPHDMLYHIIAATNEAKGARPVPSKVLAARSLLERFRSTGCNEDRMVKRTKELVDAYIELAEVRYAKDMRPSIGSQENVTTKLRRIRWKAEESVCVPTLAEGVSGSDGDAGCLVHRFGDKWSYPGGITVPKKITCVSTDGRSFTQVVKGGDDPRSDAVSSQLFSVLRILLQSDVACRQRQLDMSTYRVIPLDPTSGLIEWVDNATSLGTVLGAGSGVDHESLRARYDPSGMPHKDSRRQIDSASKKEVDQKVAALELVWSKTQPVFRHFFLERSESPQEWFRMRLAYTQSVAASSMAGFIVGLGDRHTGNILIREDRERCGELVHIDLGMVFDQGRQLPIPEKVPFRLTREMIDAMGVAHTEGVMTRCSEETLRVMRENKQALLAIVDVVLHDPLSSWKEVSSKKAAAQGFEEGGGFSPDAKLVRRSVQDRLDGWDRGEMLGVAGHVKQLIRDATAVENMASLFCGWAAWL